MGDRLKELKLRSQKRRELLALQLGVSSPDNLQDVLNSKGEQEKKQSTKANTSLPDDEESPPAKKRNDRINDKPNTDNSTNMDCEQEVEEIFTDSSAFLKGTQSANPHNDYCQHFVDTGERPQNFIRDVGLANRFEEYPKLRELIRLKDDLIQQTNPPPMYLKCDLLNFELQELGSKFEVIMIEPPLEEYQRTVGLNRDHYWSWEEIEHLDIEAIAGPRSFIWIWCGSSDGLDAARKCLKTWGFRRCEDICWIKTNIKNPGNKNKNLETQAIFQRTKEHCLMGIRGTVRRSTDGDFIHANVDIDLIIADEPAYGSTEKPVELFHVMEHFCLGRRRLHIFGSDTAIRPGWLTIGPDLTSSNFDAAVYASHFAGQTTTGCTDEIERLRPKSPPPKSGAGGGRGRGGAGWSGRGGGFGGRGGRGGQQR